jgi:dTDP-glucose pyrophosphorylase
MAGKGARFKAVGFLQPKPMISIAGKPMIEWALNSLSDLNQPHSFIFIALEADLQNGLGKLLAGKGEVISVPCVTQGAVNTTLLAEHLISSADPLVIANCDQYLDWSFKEFIDDADGFDGSVVVFKSKNPHHSYVQINDDEIVKVREKEIISPLACGGVYFYRSGLDYIEGANKLIESNDRTNGEFYITPIFNKLIDMGKKLTYFEISDENKHMLGTPEEVKHFYQKLKKGQNFDESINIW